MKYIYKINGTEAESINRGGTHGGNIIGIHHTCDVLAYLEANATKLS